VAKSKGNKGAKPVQEIVLGGELTIRRIASLKSELEKPLTSGEGVLVRLEAVTEVDLAFLQLLCAAHRQASRQEQTFAVSGEIAGRFAEALRQGGFIPQEGSADNSGYACPWLQAAGEK